MRSMKLTNQHLRVLRMNTEQPVDPRAGYTRADLKHVDYVCNLADELLGEYEARIAKTLADAQEEARQVRLSGGKAEDIALDVSRINEAANQATDEIDRELGQKEVEVVLDPSEYDWWKRNWSARENFNGFASARRAVFAIDKAFDEAETLKIESTEDGEKKLVPDDKPVAGKPKLKSVK